MDLSVKLDNDHRISLSSWDDGGVWMYFQQRRAAMSTTLNRQQAIELIEALQQMIDAE